MNKRLTGIALVVVLLTLSCGPLTLASTATPASPPTPTTAAVVQSPGPGPSPVPPSSTPAAPPTETPSPAPPTDTPAPAGLNPAGPYVIYNGGGGVWISNPDGSFPTQLTDLEAHGDLHNAVSPLGDRLALVVRTDAGLDLLIVKVPSGEIEFTIHLIEITPDEEAADPVSPRAFALYAMRDFTSIAWQPGAGRWLAFIGALGGPTADVYLYDTETQTIRQLTDGPSQAILPEWSPDGQYILHAGVSWVPPFGGAIVGPNQLDGVWAVREADGGIVTLPKPPGTRPNFAGWQDATHYWTFDSDDDCFATNLRVVDVTSGAAGPSLDFSFYYSVALAPETGMLLIAGAAGCPDALGEGVFLLPPGETTPTRLLPKRAYEITWLPESQVFQAYPEALVSGDGQLVYAPPVYEASYNPAVSRAGYQAWEVIENQAGRVVVKVPGGDWQVIMDGFVSNMIWDPVDGQTLLIAGQDGALYAAAYPGFEPHLMGSLGGNGARMAWVP